VRATVAKRLQRKECCTTMMIKGGPKSALTQFPFFGHLLPCMTLHYRTRLLLPGRWPIRLEGPPLIRSVIRSRTRSLTAPDNRGIPATCGLTLMYSSIRSLHGVSSCLTSQDLLQVFFGRAAFIDRDILDVPEERKMASKERRYA
jgi:hypothetical protein